MFIIKTIIPTYQKMFNIKFVQLFKNYNFNLYQYLKIQNFCEKKIPLSRRWDSSPGLSIAGRLLLTTKLT